MRGVDCCALLKIFWCLVILYPAGTPVVRSITCPSPPQDPRLGVHKYVKVNGVKLHYVEAGSERDEHGELRPLMVGSRALNGDSPR